MIARDEDALICDFAETYHIYDYQALPPATAAVLAAGLRNNSRSKMILAESKLTEEQILLALIADNIRNVAWMLSKDGAKGKNRPESIIKTLTAEKKKENKGFQTPEEFLTAWRS